MSMKSRIDQLNEAVPLKGSTEFKLDNIEQAKIEWNESEEQFRLRASCERETYTNDEAYDFAKWLQWWFIPDEEV